MQKRSKLVSRRFRSLIAVLPILLLLFAETLQAQPSLRSEAIRWMTIGDNQKRKGNFEQARMSYSKAIELSSDFADLYMKRARLYVIMQMPRKSMEDYNTAIQLNPYSEFLFDERAKLKILDSDYIGAYEDISTAIALNPQDMNLRDHRVDDLVLMGRYEDALKDLDTIEVAGKKDEAYVSLRRAMVHVQEGQEARAMLMLDAALEQEPNSSIAHDLRGVVLLRRKEYVEAIEEFDKALALNPAFSLAYYNRALALRYMQQPEAAMADLNKALALSKEKDNLYFSRALLKKEMGDLEGAIEDYDRALIRDSTYVDALYNRSFAYKFLGEYGRAEADAREILKLEPESSEHWTLLGNIRTMYGDYDDARLAYDKAIGIDPDDADARYNRGMNFIMSYRIMDGCRDLNDAADRLQHPQAQQALDYYCPDY